MTTGSNSSTQQMPLKIKCPTCSRVLSVPVQRIGATVRCPICEKKLRVPKPRHSKTEGTGADEKRTGAKREKSQPAHPGRKPRPPGVASPRVKREPAQPPKPEQRPEGPTKPPPEMSPPEERPPAPPDPPTPTSEDVPSERGLPKKEAPAPEPPDAPKPPPLSKSKRRRSEAPPDSSPAEFRSEEPLPREKEVKPDSDECDDKADEKEQRWRKEQDQRPLPDRPPLPRKAEERGQAKDDSRSDARPQPPPTPSRPHGKEAQAETTETATGKPEREVVRGYEHDIHRRRTVHYLGIALILTALFGAIPAVMDIAHNLRAIDPTGVSRWALALLLASGIQLAYAVYVIQLPDWSTAWVVSFVTLVTATGYAMFLGIAILAKPDSQIIQLLDPAYTVFGKKAAGWCLIMLSLSSLLAYFSGRISVRWRHAYDLLTRTATEH